MQLRSLGLLFVLGVATSPALAQTPNAKLDKRVQNIFQVAMSGLWVFKRGRFILKSYDVDASYDGEINPVRIYGEGSPTNH